MSKAQGRLLEAFFRPHSIAIIGASDSHDRPGARVLENLHKLGYAGGIYPVTPSASALEGYRCYPSILEVPHPVDLAVICVSAEKTPAAILECGRRGVRSAVVFANGFGGESEQGKRLHTALVKAHRESGLRIIGPNTVGIRMVTGAKEGMFATFAHDIESGFTPGPVAIVAQSGGLGVYFGSAYLRRRRVGTRYIIDTGNELDVDSSEAIEYVSEDPQVSCIGLILEGCKDGRRLARAVEHARANGKAVVFLKVGTTAAAAQQMESHTGSLAGSATLFQSALSNAGATIADDEIEFVDSLVIHAHGKAPKSKRMGVVTMSGGFAILSIDAAAQSGMVMPHPSVPPSAEQEPHLRSGILGNPFDYQAIGGAGPGTIRKSLEWMLGQPDIDSVVMWHAFGLLAIEERRKRLEADLLDLRQRFHKPIFGCGLTTPEYEDRLRELGVLWFEEPTRLIKALAAVTAASAEPVRAAPPLPPSSSRHKAIVGNAARALLMGMEHVPTLAVASVTDAQALADKCGRIVLKLESDRFPHKTEFGLISKAVTSTEVAQAYEQLVQARARARAEDEPLVAQPCVDGVELALGAYIDPVFGPSVMVAIGGIYVEIIRDTAFATAPIDEQGAMQLISRLRAFDLLNGARGKRRSDVEAAAQALAALSRFIADSDGKYVSVDVNPLIVREAGKGAVAVDVLVEAR